MQTWASSVPATSSTGTTLPGLDGLATSGTSCARSICSSSSKSPVLPVSSATKSSSRSCSTSHRFVSSSAGKIAPVAPTSASMLQIVPVLEVDLEDVVVDVDDRRLHLDAIVPEELELHHRHRPGGVLHERLVDGDRDLLTRDELAPGQVLFENRARERCQRARSIAK